eukprot:4615654-Pyramimonas_sp.AAC.1
MSPHDDNNFESDLCRQTPSSCWSPGPKPQRITSPGVAYASQRAPLRLSQSPPSAPTPLTCAVLDAHLPACHPRGLVGNVRGSRSSRIGPPVADASAASAAAPPTKRRRPLPTHQ